MNARERFTAIMNFEPADRRLFTPYFWPWESTLQRWRKEGLGDRHWAEPFGFDVANEHASEFAMVPVKTFVYPFYEHQVLREEPARALVRGRDAIDAQLARGAAGSPACAAAPPSHNTVFRIR